MTYRAPRSLQINIQLLLERIKKSVAGMVAEGLASKTISAAANADLSNNSWIASVLSFTRSLNLTLCPFKDLAVSSSSTCTAGNQISVHQSPPMYMPVPCSAKVFTFLTYKIPAKHQEADLPFATVIPRLLALKSVNVNRSLYCLSLKE